MVALPIEFLKDKSAFREKSRKKAIKTPEKRAKKRAAAKAKAAAKARQVELYGDDEETEMGKLEKMSKSDAILAIAKAMVIGKASDIPKIEFYKVMSDRAAALQCEGQSRQQAFSSFITSNPDGQILYKAYRMAKGPDWQGMTTNMTSPAGVPDENDQGYSKLSRAARELIAKDPTLTFQVAFARVYDQHPEWAQLTKSYQRQ